MLSFGDHCLVIEGVRVVLFCLCSGVCVYVCECACVSVRVVFWCVFVGVLILLSAFCVVMRRCFLLYHSSLVFVLFFCISLNLFGACFCSFPVREFFRDNSSIVSCI